MPPANGLPTPQDLPGTWAFLEAGIDTMMSHLTEGMEYKKYMNLYTVAYNYCTSSRMNNASTLGSSAKSGANLMGADLYERLKAYFKSHALKVCEASTEYTEDGLLRYYASEWSRFTQGATFVHRLFAYLNRHWVKREKDEGKRNVFTVYTVSRKQSSMTDNGLQILIPPLIASHSPARLGPMEGLHVQADAVQGQASRGSLATDPEAAKRRDHRYYLGQERRRQLR